MGNLLKHSVAICTEDNRIIGIEEVYTLSPDGKKINRSGVIEQVRKLGKENKLVCDCGCGGFLMLKAGKEMIKTQHFALKPGQRGIDCHSVEETQDTRNCKTTLKCWLDNIYNLQFNELRYAVPYNDIEEGKRRFELTYYVPSKYIGIVFARAEFIDAEKLGYFAEQEKLKFLVFSSLLDYSSTEQYPEYDLRVQDVQGYCAFLYAYDDYSYCSIAIVRYEKCYQGTWKSIFVVQGPLSCYNISSDGELMYDGKSVRCMTEEKSLAFREKDKLLAENAERIRKEKEALEEQRRKQEEKEKSEREERQRLKRAEQEREEIRRREKARKRREDAEKKRIENEKKEAELFQKLIDEGEQQLSDMPVEHALYLTVKNASSINANFTSIGKNGYEQKLILVYPKVVWFDGGENNIVVVDRWDKRYFIHLKKDNLGSYRPLVMPDGGYFSFVFYVKDDNVEQIIEQFVSRYKLIKK